MDLAESGVIWWIFIKGRGTEIFSEFPTPPVLWQPFKVLERLLVFWLAIWNPVGIADMKVQCAFVKGGTKSVVLIGGTMCILLKSHPPPPSSSTPPQMHLSSYWNTHEGNLLLYLTVERTIHTVYSQTRPRLFQNQSCMYPPGLPPHKTLPKTINWFMTTSTLFLIPNYSLFPQELGGTKIIQNLGNALFIPGAVY